VPRQSTGADIQPANTAAVSSTQISSTAFNTLVTDIYTEITNSLDRGGRSAMTAPLPMGGNKITGMADPTVATDASTKNYVDTRTAAFFSTGDVKFSIKSAADPGWVACNDGTIGNTGSGGTTLADPSTQALFTLVFNNITDTWAPILTSGGGATTRAAQTNAATAWAANCAISLPKALGRALAIAGGGSALTLRALGQNLGEETHLLSASEIPSITSSGNVSIAVTSNSAIYPSGQVTTSNPGTGGPQLYPAGGLTGQSIASSGVNNISVTSNNTGGAGHNNMQPSIFLNAMMKL
jgi:hypothetical protein